MWKIILILFLISYEPTASNDFFEEKNNLEFISQNSNKFNEIEPNVLDNSDWRKVNKDLLNFMKADVKPDCSYVDKIISTNYYDGYMEIVVSPVLHYKLFKLKYIQYMRLIIQVPSQAGDVIKLYKGTSATGKPAYQTSVKSSGTDYIETNVVFNTGQDYTAEYVRKNGQKVVTAQFNDAKPSWMWCMRDIIGKRPLGKLFFPGTHDSGSYLVPDRWTALKVKFIIDLLYTQGSTILSQLMQGARSFDIRMGKYNTKEKFYINHDKFKIRLFKPVLDQFKEFLASYPNEIIVLDFHRFPVGYKSLNDHIELVSFITKELGDLIYYHPSSATWGITLNDIWKTKGRIIIAYNHPQIPEMYNFYPGVDQIWANKDDVTSFVKYMDANLPNNCYAANNQMTSAMAELTPTPIGALFKYSGGVRYLASIANSLVTKEFLTGFWGDAAQIVAVDYIDSTGIVTAAIKQNALRAQTNHICH